MTIEDEHLTSRDYAREANHTRRRLAESLDELNSRLTPGQIFDEVLSYTRGGSGTFLRGLSNAAKENPIPSLLIGTGCMLFLSEKMGFRGFSTDRWAGDGRRYAVPPMGDSRRMAEGMSRGQQSYADSARSTMHAAADYASEQAERVKSATDYAGEQISEAADNVRRSANSAVNRARETLDAAGETISDTTQRARETAHDIRDRVAEGTGRVMETAQTTAETVSTKARDYSQKARDYSQKASEQLSAMQQQAKEAGRRASDRTTTFVNEQPLLVAAIGLAVGAALGALLPSTRREDELMGNTSDAVKKAAGSVASEQFGHAKTAAGRVAEEAASAAKREGLTVTAAADAAKQVSEKVKHVMTKTAEAGKDELKDFTKSTTH